ncbi:hypothetical protein NW762_005563 [Fusarium torreyae]|uniref:Uncharacterized protein n=1 Tax=Fusarium torreyae TaxID=1237075 RepID=A0A9W8VI96_9HYPO|nr:hypothetical protein NW762_005563 [Fusarium torreyae]
MPRNTRVPAPYNKYSLETCVLFRRFHNIVGAWPWQLTQGFEPPYWGQNLVQEFTTLLKVRLCDAPGVAQSELMTYLNNISMDHPDHVYAGALNRVAIGRAFKWLDDRSRVASTRGQAINTNPAPLPPTRAEQSALGATSARGDTSAQECDEDDDVPSRSIRTRSQSRRNARKRVIDSSDEEPDDDVQFLSSKPAPKKKSLIVTLKFTPLGGQKLSAAIGDCIMVATRRPNPLTMDEPNEPG